MSTVRERNSALKTGVYTVSEASRLTRLPTATVRRWAYGYASGAHHYAPIIENDLTLAASSQRAVSFLAMIEMALMAEFRKAGLPARSIREAVEYMDVEHPFAYRDLELWHDQRNIYSGYGEPVTQVSGTLQGHLVIKDVAEQFLRKMEFDASGYADLWYPLDRDGQVVVDPLVLMGQPRIVGTRIATADVMKQLEFSGVRETAEWLDLDPVQVRAARRFEREFAKVA